MSVIVWDGKTLAADRQMTNQGLRRAVSKIKLLAHGTILAWVGCQDAGLALARWYEEGRQPERWPSCQSDKDKWTTLIVVGANGTVLIYEQLPEPIEILDRQMAWGSGRDFALGAMEMGADARHAVEIASTFCVDCGLGVEAFDTEVLTLYKTGD